MLRAWSLKDKLLNLVEIRLLGKERIELSSQISAEPSFIPSWHIFDVVSLEIILHCTKLSHVSVSDGSYLEHADAGKASKN